MDTTVFQSELSRLGKNLPNLQPNSAVFQYIKWLNERIETKDTQFIDAYLPIIKDAQKNKPEKSPFLSIVTRTQGNRIEMLREVIQCLSAQTDDDFELVLIGHRVPEAKEQALLASLDEQPHSIRSKIRYIKVDHGNRATPLNVGFAVAYGDYIAVLDDDDLVFDHYVESFHKAANEAFGTLLHTYVLKQHWKTISVPNSELVLCATSAPEKEFCTEFNMLAQFEDNHCPLMSMAFPAEYFQKYGFIFDETLTTAEDWDYMMRLAPIAGVTNIPEPTAIYRWWENTENSSALHSIDEWIDNIKYIQQKHTSVPVILPAGQEKVHRVTEAVPTPPPSGRSLLKNAIRRRTPAFIWKGLRKLYHLISGKK